MTSIRCRPVITMPNTEEVIAQPKITIDQITANLLSSITSRSSWSGVQFRKFIMEAWKITTTPIMSIENAT